MMTITETTGLTTNEYGWTTATVTADHGLVDEKGRKIGGYARITDNGDKVPEEERFSVRIQATRDGMKFGATPRRTCYPTYEAALAAAHAGLARQCKSYAKKCKAA